MQLTIDTTDNRKTVVSLGGKTLIKEYQSPQEQDVLVVMGELLKRERRKLGEITAIEVKAGPGAFTSLRVGISVANALGWALKIPVNGQESKLTEPVYGQIDRWAKIS